MEQRTLLLFDIDGTLVWRAAGAHAAAVHAAIREVHGDVSLGTVDAAGRTDRWIIRALLRSAGLEDDAIDARIEEVVDAAGAHYADLCPPDLSATVIDGIPQLLSDLAARDDVQLGLVTGNVQPIAHRKLTAAGIAAPLMPWIGAYGSDAEDRNRLVPIAQQRAAAHAGADAPWPGARTVVIGDTTHDIACARAGGAAAIGVTTGACSAPQLAAADHVVETAEELAAALAALLSSAAPSA